MKKQFTLSMASPCSEQWETFLPTLHGGFCGSCQKHVVDFTTMSEQEIQGFFKHQPSGVCGRFKPQQLKAYDKTVIPALSPGWNLLRAGILGLALVIASPAMSAKLAVKSLPELQMLENNREVHDVPEDLTLAGVVKDESNKPFPGVNIYLKKNNTIGTLSDENGKFRLTGDIHPGDVIIFSFLGYEPVEYVVAEALPEMLEIALTDFHVMMGEVQADEPYQKDSQFSQLWQKVKNIF